MDIFVSTMLIFQSTLPARGATGRPLGQLGEKNYFNPRSPHGERLYQFANIVDADNISIHAPRTGSDFHERLTIKGCIRFQSTLPARGATAAEGDAAEC